MGVILTYANTMGFYLIAYLILNFLLNLIFHFIQIPFAFISRKAVYALFLVKTYILSLYFAICIISCLNTGLSQIPFLIVFSFVLFSDNTNAIRNAKDNSERNYHFISAIISVILFLAIFLTQFLYGKDIIFEYFSIIQTILNFPILANIINYVLPLFSFIIVLVTVFQILFILPSLIANIRSKKS